MEILKGILSDGFWFIWSWTKVIVTLVVPWLIVGFCVWFCLSILSSCAPQPEPSVTTIPGRMCLVLDDSGLHEVLCRG